MTVQENIEIVFRINKRDPQFWTKKTKELLDLIHLDPSVFSNRYPDQLSGGEQQRVGVARALALDPQCLLMDEPFGALDAMTRRSLQDEILSLKNKLKKTIIFVTHDLSEAFKLGDRIAVMGKGVFNQIGTKEELLNFPQTLSVKQFIQASQAS